MNTLTFRCEENCDHAVGTIDDAFDDIATMLTKSEVKRRFGRPVLPEWLLTKFNFCPKCGEKL